MGTLIQIRKVMRTSIRLCVRSIVRHPFLVAIACLLFILYRTFPVLFTVLVSVSPVLVCTAVLLGVLLSFGESNIPEIETEEKKSILLKTEVSEDGIFLHKARDFTVEGHLGEGKVVGEDVDKGKGLTMEHKTSKFEILKGLDDVDDSKELDERRDNKIEVLKGFDDHIPLIGETSREVICEKCTREELVEGVREVELPYIRKMTGKSRDGSEYGEEEISERGYSLVPKSEMDAFALENEKLLSEFVDHDGLVSRLDHSLPFEEVNRKGHEDDDESSVSGSEDDDDDDDDESSDSGSDGAESSSPDASLADIMPMLNELHPLLDVDVPQPVEEDSDIVESDEDSDAVEGNGEGEEETISHKGVSDKPVITWTEDDQKNLMNLGTSELERNQRLENLIARRRARKSMRLMAEKNLIDLESVDLPFNNISSISVGRRNPFDVPYYDDSDLPPIPGSAPSILLPRRNPFDLPYDPTEEKPDLMGDSFQEEFTTPQQKDVSFRRFESFSVGPSRFAGPRQETLDMRWKPYFVPERLAFEGTSYASYIRQLSEVSESKTSSVPDTESVCSVADPEDKKISESDTLNETEIISVVDRDPSPVRPSISGYQTADEAVEVVSDESSLASPSLWVNAAHDEMNMGQDIDYEEAGTRSSHAMELNRSEINLNADDIDRDSEGGSLSTSSEAHEDIVEVSGQSLNLVVNDDVIEDPGNPGGSSLNEANELESGTPLYDASPQVEKYLSFSSTSSSQIEFFEVGSLPLSESDSPPVHKGSGSSEYDVLNLGSSLVSEPDKIQLVSGEITVTNEHHFTYSVSPIYSQNSGDMSNSLVSESAPPLGATLQFDNHQNILEEEPSVVGMSFEKMSPISSDGKMSGHSLEDKIFQDVSASIAFEEPRAEFSERVILGEPVFDNVDKDHQILELEEIIERKEIYGLLAELDAIGDFSVVNAGKTDLNLDVMDVKSLEEVHVTLEEVPGGDQDQQLLSEAVTLKSIEIAKNEDSFSNQNDLIREKSSIQGSSSGVDPHEKDLGLCVGEKIPCQEVLIFQKDIAEANEEKQSTSVRFSEIPVDVERRLGSHKVSESSSEKSSFQGTSSCVGSGNEEVILQSVKARSLEDISMTSETLTEGTQDKLLIAAEPVSEKSLGIERDVDSSLRTMEPGCVRSSPGTTSVAPEILYENCGEISEIQPSDMKEKLEGNEDRQTVSEESVSQLRSDKSAVAGTSSGASVTEEPLKRETHEVKKVQDNEKNELLSIEQVGGESDKILGNEGSSSNSVTVSTEKLVADAANSGTLGVGEVSREKAPDAELHEDNKEISEESSAHAVSSGSLEVGETSKERVPEVIIFFEGNQDKLPLPVVQVSGEFDKSKVTEESSSNKIDLGSEHSSYEEASSAAVAVGETSKITSELKEKLGENQEKQTYFAEQVIGESVKVEGNAKSSFSKTESSGDTSVNQTDPGKAVSLRTENGGQSMDSGLTSDAEETKIA